MGSGDFGSNGSVHWRINYKENGPADHVDFDDKKHDQIGLGKGAGKDHEGTFRVTARYRTHDQAADALEAAKKRLGATGTVVELDVDVRPFASVETDPGDPQTWEVKVDW